MSYSSKPKITQTVLTSLHHANDASMIVSCWHLNCHCPERKAFGQHESFYIQRNPNCQNQPSHQKTLPWCGYGYNAPRYFPAGTYCHLSTCPITHRLPIPHCGRRQWQCLTPFCQLFGGRVWLEIVLDSNTMANLHKSTSIKSCWVISITTIGRWYALLKSFRIPLKYAMYIQYLSIPFITYLLIISTKPDPGGPSPVDRDKVCGPLHSCSPRMHNTPSSRVHPTACCTAEEVNE